MNRLTLLAAVALSATTAFAQQTEKPLMKNFMGLNTHTIQFPADRFNEVATLVRDYHPMGWDIDGDTAKMRGFPVAQHIDWEDKSGTFRSWHAPVDWSEVYGEWKKAGFEIDACIMLNQEAAKWTDIDKDAYAYGKAFAEYFGPSGKHKLVTSIEIGNEPAGNDKFSPAEYEQIFKAMARGVRDGDPKLTILTATMDVTPDGWSMPLEILKPHGELYDVINLHKYASIAKWPTWERSYPEDKRGKYLEDLQASIEWRNEHAPDKQVWITEFGYDASSQEPDPNGPAKDWKDVTDLQQAQWLVRSYLVFANMEFDRAYMYWFNDDDTPSMHAAAGLMRKLQPKPSYYAMRHLRQSLGDYRFSKAVQETEGGTYVYDFIHGDDASQHVWVIWSATGKDVEKAEMFELPGKLNKASRMPTADEAVDEKLSQTGQSVKVKVTESPVYLWFTQAN